MSSKSRFPLTGRDKTIPPNEVLVSRYEFIRPGESEPNLGLPAGNAYVLNGDADGTRYWGVPVGFTGSKGDTGFDGSVGATGFTGSKGDIGFTGSKGDTGFDGSTGAVGFAGSQGPIGFTGSRGATGFNGSTGAVGFTGSQGDPAELTIFSETTNATRYVTFTTATSGVTSSLYVTSSKLNFNPSTGTLSATNFNSLSDITFKENITPIEDSLSLLDKIDPYKFNWKDNGNESYGVIAQELEKIMPELVENNIEGWKTVSYIPIIAILVDAVKTLKNEIKKDNNNG